MMLESRSFAKSMKSPSFPNPISRFRQSLCCLVLFALGIPSAHAKSPINLSVIQRDGYGAVPIKQPQPNILIIQARVNGHPVRLILDTGDLVEGITLDSDYARVLHLP